MKTLERRRFLSLISQAAAGTAALPLLTSRHYGFSNFQNYDKQPIDNSCWLDVCAPLIIQDEKLGVESEIVLTSDTFIGAGGYADGADQTEYEIYLYDSEGRAIGEDGVARRLSVPAMHTTVIPVNELINKVTSFWGGARIRLRPKARVITHVSDLFSSAFVRWKTKNSFTNVHANPDPLQWQRADSFFYSMPFPPLDQYDCLYSLFNPYAEASVGSLSLYDQFGTKQTEAAYNVKPHSSILLDLNTGEFADGFRDMFISKPERRQKIKGSRGGTIAVTNIKGSVKNFGYLLIKQSRGNRFSIEHPIHQPPYNPLPATVPFDAQGRLKARNILFTPLIFNQKKIGGIHLDTRLHLSSGAPMEECLWLSPFITDSNGNVAWQMGAEAKRPQSIPDKQIERGVIKLGGQQSCILDCTQLDLPAGFSGGLSLPVTPLSNHTLMKVEILARDWDSSTFTHFRPGLASARSYQKPQHRGGLGTDYIVSGARIERDGSKMARDEIIGVINIDDKNIAGNPTLQIFSAGGLVAQIKLGSIPPYSCRHYLLSEVLFEKIGPRDLSLRLIDEQATLLMSVLHVDYQRLHIAADHGSDRFSTFNEFTCDPKA